MPAVHETSLDRWRSVDVFAYSHLLDRWERISRDDGIFLGSLFDPYIAEGSVFTRDARTMPLSPETSAHAAWMADNLTAGSGFGKTGFNTSLHATHPIAVYVVDSTAPDCQWQNVVSAAAGSGHDPKLIDAYCVGMIPLPHWVQAPSMGDRGLALYDLGTGIMREYFYFQKVTGKPGDWTATTAGVSLTKPGLRDLAVTNYGLQLRSGSSAVVGMHNPLGFIGIAELLRGEINHALAFTCANMGRGYSWPARGGDGLSDDVDAPVQGQWCRLPQNVDEDFNPETGKPYNPLTRLIIRAAKRYGMVSTDKNMFVHAFNGEHGGQWAHLYGEDPWDSLLPGLYGGTWSTAGRIDVGDFPWHLTEWAPVDWGRPSPDFWLRPWESIPWTG